MNNQKPDNTKLQTGALVDCVTCGLPAEITDRFTLGGAPGPVEHVKVVCVGKHWYTLPVDSFRAPLVRQRMMGVSRMDMERHVAARNIDRALVVEQCRRFAAANGGGET